jgi:hypothetical protein
MNRQTGLILIALFVLALIPRARPFYWYDFDEGLFWVDRSEAFIDAVRTGNLAETAQAFHPGVMTMYAGAASILIDRAINGPDHTEIDNLSYRSNARIVIATVNALTIVLAYLLLRRLVDARVALLAMVLWAGEPFAVYLDSILHIDGLSTSFMFLSYLAALIAFYFDRRPLDYRPDDQVRWGWWLLSGFLGGLAALAKFTSFALIGLIGLTVLAVHMRSIRLSLLPRQIAPFVVWIVVAVVTWFGLYPATWNHLDIVIDYTLRAADLTMGGHWNFFLGEPTIHPGPLYYVVTTVFRVTPWLLIGLLASFFALRRYRTKQERAIVMAFFVYIVVYFGVMAAQAKQQDRYVYPIWPALCVFGAVGLLWLVEAIGRRIKLPRYSLWIAVICLMAVNLILLYPYTIAYYNPVFGGAAVAEKTFMVGRADGYDQVAKYIREQNGGSDCGLRIRAYNAMVLQIYLPCAEIIELKYALSPDTIRENDYIVFYVNQVQRRHYEYLIDAFAQVEPAFVDHHHGIDYAFVYDMARSEPDWTYFE